MSDPHFVVLCLDTVRKDYYDQFAPRLRERATLKFEEMRAASSWSVPSHAAMVTGLLPSQSGVHAYNRDFSTLDSRDTWFANWEGYHSCCISANIYASSTFGFDTLFDDCLAISPSRRFPKGININSYIQNRGTEDGILSFIHQAAKHEYPIHSLANGGLFKFQNWAQRLPILNPFDYGAKSITRAIKSKLTEATKPTFLFANFMDAHGPHSPFLGLDRDLYDCPPSFTSLDFNDWDVNTAEKEGNYAKEINYVRQLYAAEIAYLDQIISDLMDSLTKSLDRDIMFVITADHGENLGYSEDEFLINHFSSLSEALLHVPFDVYSTNHTGIVEDYTTHLDLGEIATNLREEASMEAYTRSTIPAEIAGCGSKIPDETSDYWDRAQRAVYRDGRKYVCDEYGETNVYDVVGDPSIQYPLSDENVPDDLFDEVFDVSFEELAHRANAGSTTHAIAASTKSRLQELGYLS
ncbi:sulfatase-like hydrolase/transferase [Haladaptatus salinisoli]|uniref:sulfatase-like hydrolase/transferase n=1 Tax=Haladaptatus salinisoli TaxID=2884876 RepID=UPI001D0B7FF1|nr:sulfatase-like hydrolase/transferase [Haladaptatus salinisoli]